MRYASSLPFRGNKDKAFGLADTVLTAVGFRLTDRAVDSREWVGPGMNSTRENALRGASRVRVSDAGGERAVVADLGGVAWLSRLITVLPIGIVLGVGVVLAVVFSLLLGPGFWLAIVAAVVVANTALWLLLGPLIAGRFRARTTRTLDALLAKMVAVGESAESLNGPLYGPDRQKRGRRARSVLAFFFAPQVRHVVSCLGAFIRGRSTLACRSMPL